MSSCNTPPIIGREALAAAVLPKALRYAQRKTRGRPDEIAEAAHDAATGAIVRALDTYDPARGEFEAYCMVAVQRAVWRAVRLGNDRLAARPAVISLLDDYDAPDPRPAAGQADLSADALATLPPELREAVRLYCVEGHTLREAADVLGISHSQVRKRLLAAAERLDPGAARPTPAEAGKRPKRLKRG